MHIRKDLSRCFFCIDVIEEEDYQGNSEYRLEISGFYAWNRIIHEQIKNIG